MLPAGKRAADAGVPSLRSPARTLGSWRGTLPLASEFGNDVTRARPHDPHLRRPEFDASTLAGRQKGDQRISVCLPARNEAETVGAIVDVLRRELVERVPLVDELLVIDDHSTDRTAAVARDAGAEVVTGGRRAARYGEGHGKGEALWKSLFASDGDIVVWCDADVDDFDPAYVVGLDRSAAQPPRAGLRQGVLRPSAA